MRRRTYWLVILARSFCHSAERAVRFRRKLNAVELSTFFVNILEWNQVAETILAGYAFRLPKSAY